MTETEHTGAHAPAGDARDVAITVPEAGDVSGLLVRPASAHALLVFGHGAGAGMRHRFMQAAAGLLADAGVATLRYQFPYMEAGRRAPDRHPRLLATVGAAIRAGRDLAGDLSLWAGGKSMGGRMTSMAAAASPEAFRDVRGLVFFGFPLHAPGKPSVDRAEHLRDVSLPMLFLQGERDRLADLDLLRPVLEPLEPPPVLHVIPHADHGFHVPKRSGRTDGDVLAELARTTSAFALADGGGESP